MLSQNLPKSQNFSNGCANKRPGWKLLHLPLHPHVRELACYSLNVRAARGSCKLPTLQPNTFAITVPFMSSSVPHLQEWGALPLKDRQHLVESQQREPLKVLDQVSFQPVWDIRIVSRAGLSRGTMPYPRKRPRAK